MPPFNVPLGADALRAAGIPAPWAYGVADRVRFGEVDMLGHVNNVAYARWFETIRVAHLMDYGISDFNDPETKIVIRSIALTYLKEVHLKDDYILTTRARSMRNTSFTMDFAVWVDGQMTTSGEGVIVMLNPDNSKKPLPDAVRATLIARDGTEQT